MSAYPSLLIQRGFECAVEVDLKSVRLKSEDSVKSAFIIERRNLLHRIS